jgi:cytochrome c oxidase subunit IV
MSHPVVAPRTYVFVYVVLLLLTLTTYLSSTMGHLGVWELPVALGIATTKTLLVGMIFMHLWYTNRLTWLILAAGVMFLAIMIVLTMADYATRGWLGQEFSLLQIPSTSFMV